ncbi:Uncharacterized protein Rs2_22088 [Raphanus sativus]|uniref:Uncharacterized protein LOC130512786 n=1 Tax=Raphanus sativus TaxID=3726 RepID=A0A9W3DT92_RAPSA|nr:uncharacterized protein LOC130512786 [Raphanus sativus]KAJ4895294.1 Uncharacterized protein Rs2_22088 [Raphanus sativus]
MVNSESHSSNDQVPPPSTCSPHVGDCEEAVNKLMECAMALPKVKELSKKVVTEVFKAADLHDDEEVKFSDYMKGGACKESFVALAECPDEYKQKAMLECMEAHSDYYHNKYKEIIDGEIDKGTLKELESTFPGGEVEVFLGIHEFFTKGEGGCCKEQYLASVDCVIEEEEDQSDPLLTTFTKRLFRFL